jgi:hypothetical protein
VVRNKGPRIGRNPKTGKQVPIAPRRVTVFKPSPLLKKRLARAAHEPLPLWLAPRCCAKTRSGKPCQSPIVHGKKRCRMHGGAAGSGAPKGERNGNYRHGHYTAEAIAERLTIRKWVRDARKLSGQ